MDTSTAISPAIMALRNRADGAVFDYRFAMDCLKEYKSPRKKLHDLVVKKGVIPLRKGLYILNPDLSKHLFSPPVAANLICGPSYVSLEWACQFYGLIPERVNVVTSITSKRSRKFKTPMGLFTFKHLHAAAYPVGITQTVFGDREKCLIATKEKALTDLLVMRRGSCRSLSQMRAILAEDLRIEIEDLLDFDLENLEAIYSARPHRAVEYLLKFIKKEQNS